MSSNDRAQVIRDWKGARVLLPTRYGPVLARWTSAGHVHVGAGDSDEGTRLVYRGTEWHASIHLFAASGWTEDEPPGYSRNRHRFTAYTGGTRREIGPTWRAAIVAAVAPAVAEFVAAHPEIPAEAEVEHIKAELARAQAAETSAREEYQRAHLEAAELIGQLHRAEQDLQHHWT